MQSTSTFDFGGKIVKNWPVRSYFFSFFGFQNSQEVESGQYRKKLYNQFLPTVFDLDGLSFNPNRSQDVGSSDDSSESRRSSDYRDAVAARLETILARFVSDYRGIFAIEGECAGSR